MKKLLIFLTLLISFSSCSAPNPETTCNEPEKEYSEEYSQDKISELESEIARLNKQLDEYEERIDELLRESADFEEQSMEY